MDRSRSLLRGHKSVPAQFGDVEVLGALVTGAAADVVEGGVVEHLPRAFFEVGEGVGEAAVLREQPLRVDAVLEAAEVRHARTVTAGQWVRSFTAR
ncbi:hypothetical protein GCM10009551_067320 [Nocardiopsis tropica]